MGFYFQTLGYTVKNIDEIDFEDYELLISRVEFCYKLRNIKNLLMFEIAYPLISRPLSQDMVDKVAGFLKISAMDMPKYSPLITKNMEHLANSLEGINLPSGAATVGLRNQQKYIVFNAYVDSGSYAVTKFDKTYILKFASDYARQHNYTILLTGSGNDKVHDKLKYNDDFIDIRGKTDILSLFGLMQNNQVECYIGFDGFLMHLANMYQKRSFVIVRRSTILRRKDNVKKMLTPYLSEDDLVTIINH